MNNKEFEDLFYKVPEGVDYADILEDVDLEDVPEETIQKLTSLLSSDDEFLRYKSSRLLTIWGIREGFQRGSFEVSLKGGIGVWQVDNGSRGKGNSLIFS